MADEKVSTPGVSDMIAAAAAAAAAPPAGEIDLPLRVQERITEVVEHIQKVIDAGTITAANVGAVGVSAVRMIMEAVEATPGLTSKDKKTIASHAVKRFARLLPEGEWKPLLVMSLDLLGDGIIDAIVKATLGLFDINKDGKVTGAECRETCRRWCCCAGGAQAPAPGASMER